jgi:hypothetical protein
MIRVNRLLFIDDFRHPAPNSLAKTFQLAASFQADIHYLMAYPKVPKDFKNYEEIWEAAFNTRQDSMIQAAQQKTETHHSVPITTHSIDLKNFGKQVIEYAQTHTADLIIKPYYPNEDIKGPDASEMHLLRYSPVPVGLIHEEAIGVESKTLSVVVAIDPEDEAHGNQLNFDLLTFATEIAKVKEQPLVVLSCWDYPYEASLRNSAFISIPSSEVDKAVKEYQANHRKKLDTVLENSGIVPTKVEHLRGKAAEKIPSYINTKKPILSLWGL